MTPNNMHRHHLIPRHMGGTDDEENLTPPISIGLHAAFHKQLWEDFGLVQDYIAWKALSGRITGEEARLLAAKAGQEKSEKYKNRKLKDILHRIRTKQSCSKGGKKASVSLVAWQKNNKEDFIRSCSENGKKNSTRLLKPCSYLGVYYSSKKQLQEKLKMDKNKFYKLLRSGDIKYLDREINKNESNI